MKKVFLLTAFILLMLSGLTIAQSFSDTYSFYKERDYFRFKANFEKSVLKEKWENDFLKGMVKSIFGKYRESNLIFEDILAFHKKSVPDSLLAELYKLKAVNHAWLFEYKEALTASVILRDKYGKFLDEEEKDDLPDEIALLEAVKNELPQKISAAGGEQVQMKKDLAGLWNIPVIIAGTEQNFVFDTGANVSVITESLALKLGIKIINANIKVGTATDIKVDSKAGICVEMQIGSIRIQNAAFLVLPDSALTFGPFYKITGIIGNPVISAMKEINISKDYLLTVSKSPGTGKYTNFCYDGYTPVIQMVQDSDSLSFIFDSGAGRTMFYKPYFDLHKSDIEKNYELTDITVGGAGGMKKVKGYYLKNIRLSTGNSEAELDKSALLTENMKKRNSYFYGNLGQDYITKFSEITINYNDMYIEFR